MQDTMAQLLDELTAFDNFRSELLPKLQKMVQDGAAPDDILQLGAAMAAARLVTLVASERDSGKAMTAIKDLLDRRLGKAKERSEVEHKFGKLKEEELDAVLASGLADLKGSDDEDTLQ